MRRGIIILCLLAAQAWHVALARDGALNILLTNDDGYDAAGIMALRVALLAAGHEVTLVGPYRQQSATGVKVTLGELAVIDHGDAIWSVDGSPADATSYAIKRIMAAAPPDLVVSGANLGQNLGSNVASSGTLGAAVVAVDLGVPAVAVSVGLDLAEAGAVPERFPSTLAAFPAAAGFTVEVVDALARQAVHGTPLLPPLTVLSINYPSLPPSRIKGVRIAPLSRYGGFRLIYPERPDSTLVLSTIEPDPRGRQDATADTGLFAQGYITLSFIKPDWNAPAEVAAEGIERLGDPDRFNATEAVP